MDRENSTEALNQSSANLVLESQLPTVDDSATAEDLDPETEPIVQEVDTQKTSSESQIESQSVDGARVSQEKAEVNESTTKSQVETRGLADSETVTEIQSENPSLPLPESINEATTTDSTEPAADPSDVIPADGDIRTSSQTSELPPPEPPTADIGSEEEVAAPLPEVLPLAEVLPENELPSVAVPPSTTTPKRISKRNRSSSRKKSTERQQTIEFPPQPPVVNLNNQFHPRPLHQRQHCPAEEHISRKARKTPKH